MSGIIGAFVTILLAVSLTAVALFGLHDRSVLASPPEAVIEDFVRKLETGRFTRAHGDLNEAVATQVSPDSLRALFRSLESRVGRIIDVRGERLWMTRTTSRARAVLTADRRREVEVEFPLEWGGGEWAVADVGGLERERRAK